MPFSHMELLLTGYFDLIRTILCNTRHCLGKIPVDQQLQNILRVNDCVTFKVTSVPHSDAQFELQQVVLYGLTHVLTM